MRREHRDIGAFVIKRDAERCGRTFVDTASHEISTMRDVT
jgi:hypothetical protein